MTDTSNADASPDAQPISQPSGRGQAAKQLLDDWTRQAQQTTSPGGPAPYGVWQRGRDQPTTVAGGAPQPQQPPRPQPVNPLASTWQPGPKTPYSRLNAFPPGTRLPPPPAIQPYSMPFPNRDVSQWGQAPPYPSLPQTFELPGILQNLSQHYGSMGMPSLSVPGMLMQIFSNSYQKASMKGQLEQMKLMKEQLDLNNQQIEFNDQRRLIDYSDILSEYEAAANQTDPDKIGQYALNGMDMRSALEQKAGELQDQGLMALLNSGAPMSRVVQYLQSHEAKWRALHAANKKASEAAAGDALWDQGGDGTGATTGTTPVTGTTTDGAGIQEGLPKLPMYDSPGAEGHTALGGAQPTEPGGAQPDITGYAPSDPRHGLVMDGVQGTLDTEVLKNAPKTTVGVGKGIQAVNSAIDKITENPNLKPDQVDVQLRAISPELADNAKMVSQYQTPAGGGAGQAGGSAKERAYNQRLGRLAEKLNPGWSQAKYAEVQRWRETADKATSPVQRIPPAVQAAKEALGVLDRMQKRADAKQPGLGHSDMSPEDFEAAFGKDPEWSAFKMLWTRLNEEVDVITRGSPSVGMTEQAMGSIPQAPWLGSIASYRNTIKYDMGQIKSRIGELKYTWNNFHTNDAMPGYDPQMDKDVNDVYSLDMNTGAPPGGDVNTPFDWDK